MRWRKATSDRPEGSTATARADGTPEADGSGRRRGVVIAVGNQKGGVGKTTNTVHLAAAFGLRGYRCLVVDLDPSAGATKHLGVGPWDYQGSLELMLGRENVEALVITEDLPAGVHLIPSRPQLGELDFMLPGFPPRTRLLAAAMDEARAQYDFIFLDTAPVSAATPTVAAYASAEWLLLSALAHPLSLGGLSEAFRDIAHIRQHHNPGLTIMGVVFGNVDARGEDLLGRIEIMIDHALPGRRFRTWIPQDAAVAECAGEGITLFQLPRPERVKAARRYMDLAGEIEARVLDRPAFLEATGAVPRPRG